MISQWPTIASAKQCAITAQTLHPGDAVVCVLYQDSFSQEWKRADVLEGSADQLDFGVKVLGRWRRTVSEPDTSDKMRSQSLIAAAEALFLNLQIEGVHDEASAQLLYLLAILLERKKKLKPVGKDSTGATVYYYPKGRTRYTVVHVELNDEQVTHWASRLEGLLV